MRLKVLGTFGTLLGAAFLLWGLFVSHPMWVADRGLQLQLWRDGATSRFVVVRGKRMHYFDVPAKTAGGGQPLVLLHGFGGQATDWTPLIPRLTKQGFHVYAVDMPGYGQSGRPDIRYSIADEERAVSGLMQAIGVPRADVAGWSMGGWVALKLAADDAQRVNRLVLYDSAGTYFDLRDAETLFFPNDPAEVRALVTRLTDKPMPMPDYLANDILSRMQKTEWVRRRNLQSMMSGRDLMEFRLHQVRQPTLVMWGSVDRLIPPAVGERLADGLPEAEFQAVKGCGHLLPAECAADVAGPTAAFLKEPLPESNVARAGRGGVATP